MITWRYKFDRIVTCLVPEHRLAIHMVPTVTGSSFNLVHFVYFHCFLVYLVSFYLSGLLFLFWIFKKKFFQFMLFCSFFFFTYFFVCGLVLFFLSHFLYLFFYFIWLFLFIFCFSFFFNTIYLFVIYFFYTTVILLTI